MSRRVVRQACYGVVLAFTLLSTLPSVAGSAVRLRVDWTSPELGTLAPFLYVYEASEGPDVAQYGTGGWCGLPSGTFCRIANPAARWVEGALNAAGRAQTISLEVDGALVPYRYYIVHPATAGTPMPFGATISGTTTIHRSNGVVERSEFSLPAGERLVPKEDPVPSRPAKQRKLSVLRKYPKGGLFRLTVRRDRVVTYKDVALACGASDDKPCVAHGYLSALRVVGRSELRSPILGRFRFRADAGETVPVSVKLSRFGIRYVKRRDPLEIYLVVRYAIKGEEQPACTQVCKDKRSSFRARLRYRG